MNIEGSLNSDWIQLKKQFDTAIIMLYPLFQDRTGLESSILKTRP